MICRPRQPRKLSTSAAELASEEAARTLAPSSKEAQRMQPYSLETRDYRLALPLAVGRNDRRRRPRSGGCDGMTT